MKITVEKPIKEKLETMNVKSWPVWSKEKSVFDWEYNDKETCYVLEGQVRVTTENGETVEFGEGDLVTFPKGLKCQWEVLKDIRKHYKFG